MVQCSMSNNKSNKEKAGIYVMSGTKGNLRNIVNDNVVVNTETQGEVDHELEEYLDNLPNERTRGKGEYCIVKPAAPED